jgi:hypothetical protein
MDIHSISQTLYFANPQHWKWNDSIGTIATSTWILGFLNQSFKAHKILPLPRPHCCCKTGSLFLKQNSLSRHKKTAIWGHAKLRSVGEFVNCIYSNYLIISTSVSISRYAYALYATLRYSTLRYSTLLYATLRYSTLLYTTLRFSTLLYATLRYSTLLYATLRYSTWRSRRKEDKGYIMTLPTLLPDAIYFYLLASKGTRKLC